MAFWGPAGHHGILHGGCVWPPTPSPAPLLPSGLLPAVHLGGTSGSGQVRPSVVYSRCTLCAQPVPLGASGQDPDPAPSTQPWPASSQAPSFRLLTGTRVWEVEGTKTQRINRTTGWGVGVTPGLRVAGLQCSALGVPASLCYSMWAVGLEVAASTGLRAGSLGLARRVPWTVKSDFHEGNPEEESAPQMENPAAQSRAGDTKQGRVPPALGSGPGQIFLKSQGTARSQFLAEEVVAPRLWEVM